jgi:hypothetical protein
MNIINNHNNHNNNHNNNINNLNTYEPIVDMTANELNISNDDVPSVNMNQTTRVPMNNESASLNNLNQVSSDNIQVISKQDMGVIAARSIEFLTTVMNNENNIVINPQLADHMTAARNRAFKFQQHLVTLLLITMPSPRCQVLRLLVIGKTLIYDSKADRYWIQIPAEQSKIRKPVLQAVNDKLTVFIKFYIHQLRKYLVHINQTSPDHGHLFVNNRGLPANDLTAWTKSITLAYIGRAITTHQFRHGMVTMFHEEKNTTNMDMNNLADIMNHDVSTQRLYYYRDDRQTKAIQFNAKLSEMLFESGA